MFGTTNFDSITADSVKPGCKRRKRLRTSMEGTQEPADGVGCRVSVVALRTLRDDHRMGIPRAGAIFSVGTDEAGRM